MMASDIDHQADVDASTAEDCNHETMPRDSPSNRIGGSNHNEKARVSVSDHIGTSGGNARDSSPPSCRSTKLEASPSEQQHLPADTVNIIKNKKRSARDSPPTSFSNSCFPNASSQDLSHTWERYRILLNSALTMIGKTTVAQTVPSQPQQSAVGDCQEAERIRAIDGGSDSNNMLANGSVLQRLVQEKKTECLLLKQKVDSQNSDIVQLQAIVDDLRERKKQQASNERSLQIALKRASENATSAREEANRAEASNATLTTRVETFETVVRETKRVSMLLLREQEEIGVGMEGMEREFVQVQADLARSKATKQKMEQNQHRLKEQLRLMKMAMDEVQDNLEQERSQSHRMKRKHEELEASVQIQERRCKRLQEDLDSTQTLLLDSTSTAAESNHALEDCKQTLDRMEETNQNLHHKLQKHQALSKRQEASHQEELKRIEKENQELRVQLNNEKDKIRTLKVEKLAAEKRQESQATKISALERRLKESINLMTTSVTIPPTPQTKNVIDSTNSSAEKEKGNADNSKGSDGKNSSKFDGNFAIPRLVGNENLRTPLKAKKCCICHKEFKGLMKKCECGRKECKMRAHAACVERTFARSSRSNYAAHAHLPIVLCRTPTPQSCDKE